MPAAQPSEARIKAAIAAAQAQDLDVAEIRVERDGALRIIAKQPDTRQHRAREVVDCDDIFRVSG